MNKFSSACTLFYLLSAFTNAWAEEITTLPGVSGGAATIFIPLQPDLNSTDEEQPFSGLNYSSRTGNGLAGMDIAFQDSRSEIHRCPAIYTRDGFASEVKFIEDDQLCLDGQRMVLSNGNYGINGAVYYVDLLPGVIVSQVGNLDDAQARFLVLIHNLTKKVYIPEVIGQAIDSTEPEKILTWKISTRVTSEGKLTSFVYNNISNYESNLSEIRNGGSISSDGTTNLGNNSVILRYESRPDIESILLYGGEFRKSQRLKEVQFGKYVGTKFSIKTFFKLKYQLSQSTQRSLLTKTSRCEADVEFLCKTLANLKWKNDPIKYSVPAPLLPEKSLSGESISSSGKFLSEINSVNDMNGDGRVDLLYAYADKTREIIFVDSNNSTQSIPLPSNFALPEAQVRFPTHGDLKHVGGSDLLGKVGNKFALVSVRGKLTAPYIFDIPYSDDHLIIDIDTDGRKDLVVARKSENNLIVEWFQNLNPTENTIRFAEPVEIVKTPYRKGMHLSKRNNITGLASLVIRSDIGIEQIAMFESDKSGSLKSELLPPTDLGIDKLAAKSGLFADVNGDGLDDLAYLTENAHWAVQLNTGYGFAPARTTKLLDSRVTPTAVAGTLVVDFDGDGKDELVFPDERLVAFCLKDRSGKCETDLLVQHPTLDFGIYRFSAISFVASADGTYAANSRKLDLVAQANRTVAMDIHGDGYDDFLSPFDSGSANAAFLTNLGEPVSCPPLYGCGPKIASPTHLMSGSTKKSSLDTVQQLKSKKMKAKWTYYTLAEANKPIYTVPGLGTKERQLGENDFFYRSSMPAVAEFQVQSPKYSVHERFSYGLASYNSGGFGNNGQRWIAIEDVQRKTRAGYYFQQDFPYRGTQIGFWLERADDTEHDYSRGSPGNEYRQLIEFKHECFGPENHPASLRFGCKPAPAFATFPVKAETASAPFVSEAEFRRINSRPSNLSAVRKVWEKISKTYNQLGARGFKSKVTLIDVNGDVTYGADANILGRRPRLKELRPDRESIAVGARFCTRSPTTAPWKCGESEINFDHLSLDWDAVVEAGIAEENCGGSRCVRIVILTSDTKNEGSKTFSATPKRAGRRYTILADIDDYRPLFFQDDALFELQDQPGVGRFTAAHQYDFAAKVPIIELPK